MKLTNLLLFLTIFNAFGGKSYSQITRLNMDMNDVTIQQVLKTIEEKSEFFFLYSSKMVDVSQKVDIHLVDKKIDEILDKVLDGTNIQYLIKDRQILLVDKNTDIESILQQQANLTGIVTDKNGKILPGVTVKVKDSSLGTVTDANGKFSLFVPLNSKTLVFSFIGMKTQEIEISNTTSFTITMEEELIGMDEVIVIGYGTAKKSDLTGSVMRVDAESLKSQTKTQLTDMISGTVAGFYIKQGTSAQGGASSMDIRGQTSLLANTNPLIVLDGVIYNGSILDINPNDIATIDVLKDASSSAVFGARAASGVVIITTTKGSLGKPKISVTTSIGITEPSRNIEPYNAQEFLDFRRDYLEGSNPKPPFYYYSPTELPDSISVDTWRNYSANPAADNTLEWLNRLLLSKTESDNYVAGKSIDWYDEVIQKGIRNNYDVSLSGGTKDVTYYYSLGYTNNEGIILGDKFSTIRSRLNIDMKVAEFLSVGVNTQFANRDQSQVTASTGDMYICPPWGSKYNADGTLNWFPSEQAIAPNPLMNYTFQDKFNKTSTFFSSLYAQLNLPLGFSYRISYQPRFSFNQNYIFNPSKITAGNGSRTESQTYEWIIDNLIKWNKKFGIHDFDLTLLYSAEKNQYWNSYMENNTFTPNENLSYHGLQFGIYPALSNNDTYATGDAAMARLNYTLAGKYLLTASIRRDGYSAFGQKNPHAIFPAVALAWQVGNEDFFKIDWINQFKLRFSWGINGNRDIGIYSALATLSSNFYYNGSSAVVGVTPDGLANTGLEWEKTEAINFGTDIGIFNNRVSFSADYYKSTTKDMLMNRRLPVITGFSSMTVNLGEISNHGFEVTMNTVNVSSPKINWRSNLVFSLNRNEIVRLYGDQGNYVLLGDTLAGELPDYINKWFPGHAVDAIWDYDVVGVWQLDEAADAAFVKLQPGDYKATDVNGDGLYTETIDKQFIGFSNPRYNIGLRNDITFLKNFTASLFIRADLGHISALGIAKHGNNNMYDRLNDRAVPYWTKYDQDPVWGRLNPYGGVYAGGYNVYFSRSFVRIQDFSLSYSFPQKIIQRLKLSELRLFGSVRNLYSFDKWPDFDPESGSSPMPRTYTFGLTLEL